MTKEKKKTKEKQSIFHNLWHPSFLGSIDSVAKEAEERILQEKEMSQKAEIFLVPPVAKITNTKYCVVYPFGTVYSKNINTFLHDNLRSTRYGGVHDPSIRVELTNMISRNRTLLGAQAWWLAGFLEQAERTDWEVKEKSPFITINKESEIYNVPFGLLVLYWEKGVLTGIEYSEKCWWKINLDIPAAPLDRYGKEGYWLFNKIIVCSIRQLRNTPWFKHTQYPNLFPEERAVYPKFPGTSEPSSPVLTSWALRAINTYRNWPFEKRLALMLNCLNLTEKEKKQKSHQVIDTLLSLFPDAGKWTPEIKHLHTMLGDPNELIYHRVKWALQALKELINNEQK